MSHITDRTMSLTYSR